MELNKKRTLPLFATGNAWKQHQQATQEIGSALQIMLTGLAGERQYFFASQA